MKITVYASYHAPLQPLRTVTLELDAGTSLGMARAVAERELGLDSAGVRMTVNLVFAPDPKPSR